MKDHIVARLLAIAFTFFLTAQPAVVNAIEVTSDETIDSRPPETVYLNARDDIQKTIDSAPPHSTIVFNPNSQLVLSEPLRIDKPLVIRGLNAKLPPNLGRSPLISVRAEGVTIEDFKLYGNTDTVPQEKRAPLIFIAAGDFRVEHGQVFDSSRHGVYVEPQKETGNIVGGVIRDIVGHGNARCVIAVGNDGNLGLRVSNVLIENIRSIGSSLRGAVNIKDGNNNITVRDIYAENSVYAVDVQDHHKPGEINRNITIENVYAKNCRYAIRSDNRPLGHDLLTVRNVTAEKCAIPIRIANIDHVTLDNIRVLNHQVGVEPAPPVHIENSKTLFLRDVVVDGTNFDGPAIDVVDSNDVVIDGITLEGESPKLSSGVRYHVSNSERHSGVRISNVVALSLKNGILLDSSDKEGTLVNYIVHGNIAQVIDNIKGVGALVTQNQSPPESLSTN